MADSLPPIDWRIHFRSLPETVWEAWTTDAGRERFWAERSVATENGFSLQFINGETLSVWIDEAIRPSRFVFTYFGGSRVTLALTRDDRGGCDLRLIEEGVSREEHLQNYAGWVSVLLACKAAIDFDIDLRSHDPDRTWGYHYVDV
jgi:uncharacterized protein YndB with AHSA1/START domain